VCGSNALSSEAYHLLELRIASDPADPRRKMPPILPTDRAILDVGCGAGQTLIASRLQPGIVAAGVDIDRAALALGRELERNLHLACAKGEQLPFRTEYFDLVFSRVAVPYMEIPAALDEMFRVLKVNGRLWIVLHPSSMTMRDFWASWQHRNLRGVISRAIVMLNGLFVAAIGRTLPLGLTAGRSESFQTRRGMVRVLRRIGFVDIQEIERSRSFTLLARKGAAAR
jgi:hypothetical protein